MQEILKLWLKHQTPRCKPHSIRMYKTACKRLTISFGDLRPEEINTLLIEKFQDKLLMVGLSPRTINFQVGIALSAIRWAHDRELIEHGPPKSKPLKVRVNHSRKSLTASELKKLMAKLREPRWERLTPFVMIALYAGLRQQEIAWLTWEDVDLAVA
jgi:integrase